MSGASDRTSSGWMKTDPINVKIKGSAETEINAQGPAVSAQALDELMRKLDALGEGRRAGDFRLHSRLYAG